jgi:membrane-associated phospholipid phosphatase
MAGVLNPRDEGNPRAFWAVDKIILGYVAFTTVLILGWWTRLPEALTLLLLHLAGAGLLIFEVKYPNPTTWIFRNWYPLPYVASCYKEMALLIPAVRRTDADAWLARLDFRVWGAHPTVWLERIQSPAATEFLQIAYTLFVPAVLLVAALIWAKHDYRSFQYYAFLIALGFLVSYVGYLIVPARGPRFYLKELQHVPLQGLWLFHGMQSTLDQLESAHYDCFPSGHTELTLLACWGSSLVSKRSFKIYLAYTPFLIFATVYLRYHYTIDVLAGAVVAGALIVWAPALYRKLSIGSFDWEELKSSRPTIKER